MSEDCVSSADTRVGEQAMARSMANAGLKIVFIGGVFAQQRQVCQ
jgi:hypothetical protein